MTTPHDNKRACLHIIGSLQDYSCKEHGTVRPIERWERTPEGKLEYHDEFCPYCMLKLIMPTLTDSKNDN